MQPAHFPLLNANTRQTGINLECISNWVGWDKTLSILHTCVYNNQTRQIGINLDCISNWVGWDKTLSILHTCVYNNQTFSNILFEVLYMSELSSRENCSYDKFSVVCLLIVFFFLIIIFQ